MPFETLPTLVIGMIVLETSAGCEPRQNARIYRQPRCVVDARMPRYVKVVQLACKTARILEKVENLGVDGEEGVTWTIKVYNENYVFDGCQNTACPFLKGALEGEKDGFGLSCRGFITFADCAFLLRNRNRWCFHIRGWSLQALAVLVLRSTTKYTSPLNLRPSVHRLSPHSCFI